MRTGDGCRCADDLPYFLGDGRHSFVPLEPPQFRSHAWRLSRHSFVPAGPGRVVRTGPDARRFRRASAEVVRWRGARRSCAGRRCGGGCRESRRRRSPARSDGRAAGSRSGWAATIRRTRTGRGAASVGRRARRTAPRQRRRCSCWPCASGWSPTPGRRSAPTRSPGSCASSGSSRRRGGRSSGSLPGAGRRADVPAGADSRRASPTPLPSPSGQATCTRPTWSGRATCRAASASTPSTRSTSPRTGAGSRSSPAPPTSRSPRRSFRSGADSGCRSDCSSTTAAPSSLRKGSVSSCASASTRA